MKHEHGAAQPTPRSIDEIFNELRALAQSDGALHEISRIVYRDWVITVDTVEGRIVDDVERRWSTSKLNKNELLLLLGLAVQSDSDRTFSVYVEDDTFARRADTLLRELHDRINLEIPSPFNTATQAVGKTVESIGMVAREAIYYGADSFYLHQFVPFSRLRYRDDWTWLLQHAGLSIRPILEIANFIVDRINVQMTAVGQTRKDGHALGHPDLTNSLLISKADVRERFGEKANSFFEKFTSPATCANRDFNSLFAVNAVGIAPLIDLGDHLYVPSQYRLFEAIYESPFYWMMADTAYRDAAAEHRGAFLERTAATIFRSVFGAANVHENVTIRSAATKEIAGEIDVLVTYGEFVLVVQAKSKRVTLKARAGDIEALQTDFQGAIQSPYMQALECLRLIRDGAKCVTKDGKVLSVHALPRFFPVVVLSDPFPGSTFLSHALLQRENNVAPVIWDLGVLDCVAELLPSPIEMIFYLKCRSDVFDKVLSDSEYNFLGYHLRAKLAISPDTDLMMLDRDFATMVDDYMIAKDVGTQANRPVGILERLQLPVISDLLTALKNADPQLASVAIDLYDFSGAALKDISGELLKLREDVSTSGKAIKALSIQTNTGGLTYAVTRVRDKASFLAAEAIGTKHKYDSKRDRWYVVLDCIETKSPLDGLLPLVWAWQEDEQQAKSSEQFAKIFKSWQVATPVRKTGVGPGK